MICRRSPPHGERSATLVEPRTVPPDASLNLTKMRAFAGSKLIAPVVVAKMLKVGVAFAPIVAVNVLLGAARH